LEVPAFCERKQQLATQLGKGLAMQGIVINYRHDDSERAARALYNELARDFGQAQVFMHVEDSREKRASMPDTSALRAAFHKRVDFTRSATTRGRGRGAGFSRFG
jgi:hypothetical protein